MKINRIFMLGLFCLTFNSYAQQANKEQEPQTILAAIVPELSARADSVIPKQSSIDVFLDSKYENFTKFTGDQTLESRFKVVQSRVYLKGTYKNKLSYAMRYRLNEEKSANALEFAFLSYQLSPHWSVEMGRMFTAFGSMELSYNSADLYMFTNIIGSIELFSNGVAATYKNHGQSFKFQLVSSGEQFTTPAYKNKAYAGLFLWEGSLFNEHLKTRYGIAAFGHDANKYYSYITLGNRLVVDDFLMELDWMYGTRHLNVAAFTLPGTVDNPLLRDNTTTASFKYRTGALTPYVKVMYNYRKDLEQDLAYSYSGVSIALEYNPFKQAPLQDLRLFGAYNFYAYDYFGYQQKPDLEQEQQIAVGVRWMIPLF